MSLEIREASAADVPLLVELMREFYAESAYPIDGGEAARSFRALIEEPALGSIWIFLADSVPAGYIVLTVRFSMENGGLDGFIDDLFVRPAYRRRGVAHRGLERLFAECARRGIVSVHVEVGENNEAALRLYAGFGMRRPTDGRQTLSVPLSRLTVSHRSGFTEERGEDRGPRRRGDRTDLSEPGSTS